MSVVVDIYDLNDWIAFFGGQSPNTNTCKTVKAWTLYYGADIGYNLGVFNTNTGASYTYVSGPTVLCDSQGATDPKIGGASQVLRIDSKNACKGYSNGIINGVISINAPMNGSAVRNGIGLTTNGKVVVAQSKSKMTERAFCIEVNSIVTNRRESIKLFIFEDGGGSTAKYSNLSKNDWHPTGENRPVPTVICFKRKTAPRISRDLYRGATGEDVRMWQTIVGGGLVPDGSYGPSCVKAAIKVAKNLGLPTELQKGVSGITLLKKLGYMIN